MFKTVLCFSMILAVAMGAPKPGVLLSAPAPIVTATSSQVVARNYNAAVLAAPLVAAAPAPLVAAAPAPFIAAAPAPVVRAAPYFASPYAPAFAAPYSAYPYVF